MGSSSSPAETALRAIAAAASLTGEQNHAMLSLLDGIGFRPCALSDATFRRRHPITPPPRVSAIPESTATEAVPLSPFVPTIVVLRSSRRLDMVALATKNVGGTKNRESGSVHLATSARGLDGSLSLSTALGVAVTRVFHAYATRCVEMGGTQHRICELRLGAPARKHLARELISLAVGDSVPRHDVRTPSSRLSQLEIDLEVALAAGVSAPNGPNLAQFFEAVVCAGALRMLCPRAGQADDVLLELVFERRASKLVKDRTLHTRLGGGGVKTLRSFELPITAFGAPQATPMADAAEQFEVSGVETKMT